MKRIVILGAGESGAGAAVLAKQKGFDVFVSDMSYIAPNYKALLDQYGIAWEEGKHTDELVLTADEVIKSPGIPKEAPMVCKLIAQGTPIISEIEFAGRYTHAKMVCITGSNGKTTTTSLAYHIFKTAGWDVGLAGNIGKSLALQVALEPHEWYVIELSSFQLDDMYDFRADIAVLLNITPDHLDRYENNFDNYARSKFRITRNQTPSDVFIYWSGDPVIQRMLPEVHGAARQLPFALEQCGQAAYTADDALHFVRPEEFEMPLSQLSLMGTHNLYNSMAAALAAFTAGIPAQVVARCLGDFPGVEHRQERVGVVNGILYINDSKATNVDACRYALDCMPTPTVLIIGGKDKGNDYAPLRPLVQKKCRALVYLGADNAKLHANFDDLGLPVADTHSMKECVEACTALAQKGDTVLLSPCCASFDLFHNMEDRGEQFKECVKSLSHV